MKKKEKQTRGKSAIKFERTKEWKSKWKRTTVGVVCVQNSIRKVVKRKVLFWYSIRVRQCQTTAAKFHSAEKWWAGVEPWVPTPNIDVKRQVKTFSIYFPCTINLGFSAVLCCIWFDLIRLPVPSSNLQQISFLHSESNVLRRHIWWKRASAGMSRFGIYSIPTEKDAIVRNFIACSDADRIPSEPFLPTRRFTALKGVVGP